MRNFKRCLAMTLTVLMIVSCFSFVSVNAFDDVYDFEEAIDTLNGLGVIKGYDDTTFGPDDDVLRWHMALLVAKLVTGEVRTSVWESTANNTKFADVKPEHYYGSITWASGTGVIIGTSETTFEPEGKITFQDALTMVVRALGFGGEAMDKGYPWKYIQKGEDLGLTFGLEYIEDYETYLTRGETAQLLYNALYAENADGVTYAVDSFGLVEADVETVVLTGTNRFSMLSNEKVIKTGYVAFNPLNEDGSVNETLTYYIDKAAFGIEGNEDNYVGNVYDVYSTDGFASFVKVVEVAAEEAELVGNANNATNLVTINGTTYKVVESYSKLHATGEYQGNYPEIILYARDSVYAKANASYVTDAYGNLLDAKGQVALYYMPHLVGFVNPYVTIDDAGVIRAATTADFAKAALVSAGDVHCYKKITNTLTEITNIGAVYDAEAVDVNGDGLYDRGMFVNYSYGAYGVDANGNLTIGSVATGRKANEIKYVDAEGNEIAAIGAGYYLYSYNAEGGILTIKETLSVYSGYLSGLNTITNQLTIGGTVYNYGIKNLPAAEEANVEADITAALIGKNIQYVMYDGVVIDILAVANAGYVILDSVIGVTSTGLPTALVYNSTSNFATVIVVATLDTYSHYNFNFGTDALNSVNSLLAAKAKGSVFTAQIDALGYYHLTTADSALQVNTGANNVIDFKNGISNSTAITGQITVNDNTVFLLYNDGKFTAIKGMPSNGAELVINAGAQYLTVSAGGVTSFIYVKGGSFSGTTQLPSWNNPANTTIVYIDNATSVATIVDNGLSSIIGVEGMTLLGYTYKYSAVLDVVNGKAIDVYSVSYNAQVKAGKFYSVVNGYIDREIDITAADSPIKLGYLGKLTETSGTFVANGTNALTSYDRENTVLVALDANGNVVRAANSMATFNYATDAATKAAINVDTKYLPVYYYVGTDIRPAANTFFAMDGVTALVNASDITIGEPTPEEIVIVPPVIAPGEGITGTLPNFAEVFEDAEVGDTVTLPEATLEKEGFTFAGWKINGVVYQAGAEFTIDVSTLSGNKIVIEPVWEEETVEPEPPVTYTVTYVGGDGATGEAPTQDAVEAGTKIVLANCTFTKENFTFAGWDIAGTVYLAGDEYTVTANTTITATWTENEQPGGDEPEPPVVEGAEMMQIFVEDNETLYGEKATKDVSVQFKGENINGVQAVIIAFDKTKVAPITTVDGAEELGQDYLLSDAIAMKDGYDYNGKFDSYADVEAYFYALPAAVKDGIVTVDEWAENGVAPVISYAEIGDTGYVYLMFKQNKIVNYAEWTTGITLRFAVLSGEVAPETIGVATTADANTLNASNSAHVATTVEGQQTLYIYVDGESDYATPLAKPATVVAEAGGGEDPEEPTTYTVTYAGGSVATETKSELALTGPWGAATAGEQDGATVYTQTSGDVIYCALTSTDKTEMPESVETEIYVSDVTKLGNITFELVDNDKWDTAIAWNIATSGLENGWNTVTLNVADGVKLFGKNLITDPSIITFIRAFSTVSGEATLGVKSLNFVYEEETLATGTAPTQDPVEENATITLADNTFTLEGYTFKGWNDGTNTYEAGATYAVSKNTTLTAVWEKNAVQPEEPETYAVTYVGGEGAEGEAPTQDAVEAGTQITVAENTFTKEGFTFAGWSDGTATVQPGATYTVNAAVTFTAVWEQNAVEPETYTVTYKDVVTPAVVLMGTEQNDGLFSWGTGIQAEGYVGGHEVGACPVIAGVPILSPVDASAFINSDTATFDAEIYIDDASKISYGQIELCTTGCDNDEIKVDVTTLGLQSGWNTVSIPLSSFIKGEGGGTFNPASLGYIRMYIGASASNTLTIGARNVTLSDETVIGTPAEVEAGDITLAAAITKDGYTFIGWNDGTQTYDANATYTLSADTVFTAVWEQNAVEPEPPVVEGAEFMQIFVEDNETPYGEKETKDVSVQFKAENISGVQAVIIAFDKTKLAPITTVDGAEELGQDYLLTEAIAMKDGYDFDAKFDSYEDVEQYFYTLPAKERQGLTVVDEWVENGVAPVISYAEVGNTGFVYLMFKQNKIVNYAEWTTGITLRFAVLSGEVTADVIRVATTAEANALNASNSGHVALDVEGTQQLYVYYDDGTENSYPLAKPATVIDGAEAPVQTVSVTYVGGEGTTGTAPSQGAVAVGTEITLADNTFTKENHEFAGWQIGEAVLQPGATYTVTADTTITAQWTAITYTVTFAGLDGITGETPTQDDVTANTVITLPAAPVKNGFTFKGWNDGTNTYDALETYAVSKNTTFTAEWEEVAEVEPLTSLVLIDPTTLSATWQARIWNLDGVTDFTSITSADATTVAGKTGIVKTVHANRTSPHINIQSFKLGLEVVESLDWYKLVEGCDPTANDYYVVVELYIEDVAQIDGNVSVSITNKGATKWTTSVLNNELVSGWNLLVLPLDETTLSGEVAFVDNKLPLTDLAIVLNTKNTDEVDVGLGTVTLTDTIPEIEDPTPEEPTTFTVTYMDTESVAAEKAGGISGWSGATEGVVDGHPSYTKAALAEPTTIIQGINTVTEIPDAIEVELYVDDAAHYTRNATRFNLLTSISGVELSWVLTNEVWESGWNTFVLDLADAENYPSEAFTFHGLYYIAYSGLETPITIAIGDATLIYDAELSSDDEVAAGEITLAAAPEAKEGYNFIGWNDGEDTYEAGATYTLTADATFTAVWEAVVVEPETYTVTYVDTETVATEKAGGISGWSGATEGVVDGHPSYTKAALAEPTTIIQGINTVTEIPDAIEVELYVDDAAHYARNETRFNLLTNLPDVQLSWKLTNEVWESGWNTFVLDLADAENYPSEAFTFHGLYYIAYSVLETPITIAIGDATLIYDAELSSDDEVVAGEITLAAAPEAKEGFNFIGWNDGEDTYAAGAAYTLTADTTFTAIYEKIVENVLITKGNTWGTAPAADVNGEKAFTHTPCPVYCAHVSTEATEIPDYVKVRLYIADASIRIKAESGEYALFELNNADSTKNLCWNLTNVELVNGWNELILDVDDALRNTLTSVSELNNIRFFQYTTALSIISVGTIQFGYEADPEDTLVDVTKLDNWGAAAATTPVDGETTYFDSPCPVYCALVSTEATEMPDYVNVKIYINDASLRTVADGLYAAFEINGPAGQVIRWDITKVELQNGWNELTLEVEDAVANTLTSISGIASVRYFQYTNIYGAIVSVGAIELGYNA